MSPHRRLQRMLLVAVSTAAFALSATGAQAAPGVVNASGSFVEGDVLGQTGFNFNRAGAAQGTVTLLNTLTGTLQGTEVLTERDALQPDGSIVTTASGTFTGTIIGPDNLPHQGTIQILDTGNLAPGDTLLRGTFTLINGTGGLAGVHGQGTFTAIPGTSGDYQGQIFFP